MIKLKRLFLSYRQCVLHYHEQPGLKIPTASNSSAAEGNVLEVLNMSLNGKVWDKNYAYLEDLLQLHKFIPKIIKKMTRKCYPMIGHILNCFDLFFRITSLCVKTLCD